MPIAVTVFQGRTLLAFHLACDGRIKRDGLSVIAEFGIGQALGCFPAVRIRHVAAGAA